MRGASFQHCSRNDKLSTVVRRKHENGRYQSYPKPPFVCSTYVSIEATCPRSCRFRDAGCYPQIGETRTTVIALDKSARGLTGLQVAKAEADQIDAAWAKGIPQDGARGGRDLRLHVSGETANYRAARILGQAIERWRSRGGGQAWTYTHNWCHIHPEDFGPISVLASVETPEEAESAMERGYTPAMVLIKFPQVRAFCIPGTTIRLIPCPAQTRHVKCINCRLCLNGLPKGRAIGFQLHGFGINMAMKRLTPLDQLRLPGIE